MNVTIEIEYDIVNDSFKWGPKTNVKKNAMSEVLEGYIRTQIGAGEDKSEPEKKDVYHIELNLDLSDDSFRVSHDCGNEGLLLGIMCKALNKSMEYER